MQAAWDVSVDRRKRRRRRRKEEEGGMQAGAAEQRLREARAELLGSEFWDSSHRIISKALGKHLVAAKEEVSMLSAEKALLALENLRVTPAVEAELEPSSQPGEGPVTSRADRLLCVCYGVGNFSSCVKSRYQLAFLLLLLKELKIPEKLCYVFDPVFSSLEVQVLNSLGVTVLLENEEGKRRIHDPTVFYMVHCGKALYNNLLWSNWSVEALSKMAIIGNSFKGIEERVLTKIFQKDYSYIAKVLTASEEEALPSHPRYLDVFNDTSIHYFPLHKLRELPPETWMSQEEPDYPDDDELEIIRRKP